MKTFTHKLKSEYLGHGIAVLFGVFIILLTISIFGFLIYKGGASFWTHGHSVWQFLFSTDWNPADLDNSGTIGSAVFIYGSIVISGLGLLIATPFAVATSIFINDISPKLGKRLLRPATEIFVGIPSVVYGWIGFTVLVPFINLLFHPPAQGYSVLAGGIVLAVMIFPTITSVSADAIANTPSEYKEAAYGLGATRWQMIWRVKLKAALPGILTGVVLGLARAFGEALAVAMVIGRQDRLPTTILSATGNLTSKITSDMGNTVTGSDWNDALWAMALLLFVISMIFIIVIRIIGKRGEQK